MMLVVERAQSAARRALNGLVPIINGSGGDSRIADAQAGLAMNISSLLAGTGANNADSLRDSGGNGLERTGQFFGPSAVFVPQADRWRGNQYVRDDGILPWRMCMSDSPEYRPKAWEWGREVAWKGKRLGFSILAASVWGDSDDSGKPTAASNVSLLIFYQNWQDMCQRMNPASHVHCVLPSGLGLMFDCKVGGGEWRRATRISRTRNKTAPFWTGDPMIATDTIYCDIDNGLSELKDKIQVSLRVYGDDAATEPLTQREAQVDVCYTHVNQTWPVAVCTEPMFGFEAHSKFWYGNAAANSSGHSLIDEFIVAHTMQGAKVNMHAFDDSLAAPMRKYAGNPSVAYRPGWDLPEMYNATPKVKGGYLAYEAQALTACFWEHRTSAKWVQIMNADNMAHPFDYPKRTMGQLAHEADTGAMSEVYVPTANGATPRDFITPPKVIPHQYSLIGRTVKKRQYTPLGDPRAFDAINIHWFKAPRRNYRGTRDWAYSVQKLRYRVMHMMGLSRAAYDSHWGSPGEGWKEVGDELIKALKTVPVDRFRR